MHLNNVYMLLPIYNKFSQTGEYKFTVNVAADLRQRERQDRIIQTMHTPTKQSLQYLLSNL